MTNHPEVRKGADLLLVFAATLVVYVSTIPGTITLEDAGLFQMICHLGGLGHPPGYPLFTSICQPFVSLPIFPDGVFAGNFLSSVFASLACVVFFSCCYAISEDRVMAYLAAFAYGFSAKSGRYLSAGGAARHQPL